jgi:hypothetical protein
MSKNEGRYVTAIFCDDIRNEVGGKISYMGCYASEIIVEKTPAILPKFCVFASAFTPKNKVFKSLTLRIVQDDDVELARIEIPKEGLKEHSKIADKTATRKCINAAIVFAPFAVEKPSMLRLNAITEEGEIAGPRILIKVSATQEPTVQPAKKPKTAKPKAIK